MALVGHISGSSQTNSLIGVSGTVIIANRPDALFPSALPGADVSFFVSGTIGGKGGASRTVSVFGGDAHVSGNLVIGTGSVIITSNNVQFSSIANRIELSGNDLIFFDGNNTGGKTLASLAAASAGGNNTEVQYNNGGALAGSSAFTFDASTGRVTAAHVAAGTALTASIVKAPGSSVDLFNDVATTINFGAAATTLNVGASAGTVTIAGDLQVTGNDIKSSLGQTAITLAGSSVIIPGDLTVNGTTTTINTNNLEVKDAVIGLGFASGTQGQSGGDRGLILGLGGSPHAAFLWKHTESEFAVGTTTSSATGSLPVTLSSYSNFHANNIQGSIITASLGFSGSHTKLADGTSAFVAGSGIQITSASNGAVTITSTASTSPGGSNTNVQFNDSNTFGGIATFSFDKTAGASGLGKLSVNETLSTTLTSSTLMAGASTVSVFNTTATTLNIGGAATSILIGGSSVAMGVGGAGATNSTITASTGSFGRVIATGTGTSTFAGTISANNGISATGNSSFSGGSATFSSTANIVAQGTGNQMNGLTVSGSTGFYVTTGPTGISGSIALGDAAQSPSDTITFYGSVNSNILPTTDRLYNLGSATQRWANVYTGDLHLRNERGNWTVIEEETYLSIRNNHTGKMYKFVLEEIVDPVGE